MVGIVVPAAAGAQDAQALGLENLMIPDRTAILMHVDVESLEGDNPRCFARECRRSGQAGGF